MYVRCKCTRIGLRLVDPRLIQVAVELARGKFCTPESRSLPDTDQILMPEDYCLPLRLFS